MSPQPPPPPKSGGTPWSNLGALSLPPCEALTSPVVPEVADSLFEPPPVVALALALTPVVGSVAMPVVGSDCWMVCGELPGDKRFWLCFTSEDINSTAYALTVQRAVTRVWLPKLKAVIEALTALARSHRDAAMLCLTHGQPATPSTMGKEIGVFAWRLQRIARQIEGSEYLAKFSGATGTWSAHLSAAPDVDWREVSRAFVEALGIGFNPVTTQIESHDWQVELYDRVRHAGGVLHNLATDIWTYISMGYFAQIPVAGATGSSTMPHKINPIRFENAEANLEIAGGLFATLAQTLVTSRLQRDLTDSTTQRNIGVAFGHSMVALDNLQRGLGEISLSREVLDADLDANWEVLAEAIQTVVRAEITAGRSKISDPYALLKDLTRGRRVGAAELAEFVQGLEIGEAARARLLALTPATYTGLAAGLVDLI